MKNTFIFLSVITVFILAAVDMKERLKELDNIAIKTPAQVEVNQGILEQRKFQDRNSNQNDYSKQQQNPNNSFNNILKQQQNNNLPQTKQNNPLQKN